jgi:D-inositol-3-phosphate glycosyltransferase
MLMDTIAFISVHGCPDARLGSREAGGMNVYIRKVAIELADRGFKVDIYTRKHSEIDSEIITLANNVRIIHITAGSHALNKNEVYDHLETFTQNIISFVNKQHLRYDLIQSHYWLSGSVGSILARIWKSPHFITFHTLAGIKVRARFGEEEPLVRFTSEKRIMKLVDRIVAFTEHEKQAIANIYGIHLDKIDVIPCGVDIDLFKPIDKSVSRAKIGISTEKIALYVGRIDPLKGLEILLRAVALLDAGKDLSLIVVGGELADDPEMMRLQSIVKELGIQEHVVFTGSVEQEQLPFYYNAADVCVVPSYYESFGLVALESMACGTPVIASRVGGLPSIVKNGHTGYLVQWRCPEPFADRLEIVLNNHSIRTAMKKSARHLAMTMQWSEVTEHLVNSYKNALG